MTCALPVRIRTRTGWMDVRLLDLSRAGIRIGLPVEAVDLRANASLLDVARCLGSLLPERIDATLGASATIDRSLRVVRICKLSQSGGDVELGCLLDRPLDVADALELGVVLPGEGESWDQAERKQAERRQAEPKHAEP